MLSFCTCCMAYVTDMGCHGRNVPVTNWQLLSNVLEHFGKLAKRWRTETTENHGWAYFRGLSVIAFPKATWTACKGKGP